MPGPDSRRTDVPASAPERCLPIRVPLRDGESLDSWIEALAARNGVAPAELLAALGLTPPRTAFGLMLGLAPESLRRIERQTGLGQVALDVTVLDPYLPFGVVATARQALPQGLWRRWTRGTGSSFCPQCLAESGGRWQRRWYLRWSFVCRQHRSVLAAGCPRCARSPRSGEARWNRNGPSARCAHPDPGSTARTVARPRCDADLTAHPGTGLDHDHPLLAAQQWIDALLDPDRADAPVTLVGLTVPRIVAVEAVSALIRALLAGQHDLSGYTVTRLGHPRIRGRSVVEGLTLAPRAAAGTVSTALQAGTDPAVFGVAATLAIDALDHRSLGEAADSVLHILAGHSHGVEVDTASVAGLRLHHSTGGERTHRSSDGTAHGHVDRGPGHRRPTIGDPIIDAVLLRRAAPTTRLAERLSYRTENPIPRRPLSRDDAERRWPHQPGRPSSIPARLVPQRAWPAVIDALGDPDARRDTIAFAATVSMALVRIGTFTPWSQIALQLGLPSGLAHRINQVWQRIGDHGDDIPILTALDNLVEALLERPPPIDYARRRWVFRTLTAVPMARLRRACHQAGLVATPRRRRYSTMLTWETLTGSDIRLHPGDLAPHDRGDRSAYAAFRTTDAPKLADFFAEEAERRLLRHRINEPITWTPYPDPDGGPGDGGGWCAPEPDLTRRLSGWSAPSRTHALRRTARDHTPRSTVQFLIDKHYRVVPELVSDLWRFRPDRPRSRRGMRHPFRGMIYSRPWLSADSVPLSIRRAEEALGVVLLEPCNAGDAESYRLTPTGNELVDRHSHSICGPHEYDPWTRVADDPGNVRTTLPPDHLYSDPFRLEARRAQEVGVLISPTPAAGRDLTAAPSTSDPSAGPGAGLSSRTADHTRAKRHVDATCENEAC